MHLGLWALPTLALTTMSLTFLGLSRTHPGPASGCRDRCRKGETWEDSIVRRTSSETGLSVAIVWQTLGVAELQGLHLVMSHFVTSSVAKHREQGPTLSLQRQTGVVCGGPGPCPASCQRHVPQIQVRLLGRQRVSGLWTVP